MDNSERTVLEVDCHDRGRREELFNEAEKADDSDQVVVGEVVSNPDQTFSLDNEEDDDCVILDGDPDKPVAIENDGRDDSDDLCLVGEKGQVACRDYPHPRHLCAKFPFDCTPHERHCDKCHCYVCDSVAPCVHWGSGASNVDHCHATEKNAFWEAQRKGLKSSYEATPFVPEVGLTPMNQVSLPSNNLLMQNVEPPASQLFSITGDSNNFHPCLVHYNLQKQGAGPAGTQLVPRHVPFKRPGTSGGMLTTARHLDSPARNNYGYQFSANESLGSRWQDPRVRGQPVPLIPHEASQPNVYQNVILTSPANVNYPCGGPVSCHGATPMSQNSQSHAVGFTQPISETFLGGNLGNLIPKEPAVATLQSWRSHLNQIPLQPLAASQPNVSQNVVPNQPLVTSLGSSESPINFYRETPTSLSSQSLSTGCTELQSSIEAEKPSISNNLQLSPVFDSHQEGIFKTWSFDQSAWKDLDNPLSSGLLPPKSAPMDGASSDS